MLPHLTHLALLMLFVTGLMAGTVDAIAGGGGLIALPVLLSFGLPVHMALGTNKLQGAVGTLVATQRYYREGLFSFANITYGLFFSFLGGSAGSILSQILSNAILTKIMPILLGGIFIYTIFSPKLGEMARLPKLSENSFYLIFGFLLGFYDGFFGPGTGSLWVIMFVFFLGYSLVTATAYTKMFNLNSSIIASICFAVGHQIDYPVVVCMAGGQLLGGYLGAWLAIKNGAQIIRPIFLGVVFATICTLMYKNYGYALHNISQSLYGKALEEIFGTLLILAIIGFFYAKFISAAKEEFS